MNIWHSFSDARVQCVSAEDTLVSSEALATRSHLASFPSSEGVRPGCCSFEGAFLGG